MCGLYFVEDSVELSVLFVTRILQHGEKFHFCNMSKPWFPEEADLHDSTSNLDHQGALYLSTQETFHSAQTTHMLWFNS